MNGNTALKQLRIDRGYTVRGLAMAAGISPNTLTYYENGESPVIAMSVSTAIRLFMLYEENLELFAETYYPFKENLTILMEAWKKQNPRIQQYSVLKRKIYLHLAKIKERKQLDEQSTEQLVRCYRNTFEILNDFGEHGDFIPDKEYEKYIIPLIATINEKMASRKIPSEEADLTKSERTAGIVMDAILHSEYSSRDISYLCGLSYGHINKLLNGKYDITRMQCGNALKICYILGLEFSDTFLPRDNDCFKTNKK